MIMTVSIEDRVPNGIFGSDGIIRNANSLYDPSHCVTIIKMGHLGASWAEMAIACGVSKQTANTWKKDERKPEWAEAVKTALTASEAFRNRQGAMNIEWTNSKGEPQFRSEVWKELKNEFKEELGTEPVHLLIEDAKFKEILARAHKDEI